LLLNFSKILKEATKLKTEIKYSILYFQYLKILVIYSNIFQKAKMILSHIVSIITIRKRISIYISLRKVYSLQQMILSLLTADRNLLAKFINFNFQKSHPLSNST